MQVLHVQWRLRPQLVSARRRRLQYMEQDVGAAKLYGGQSRALRALARWNRLGDRAKARTHLQKVILKPGKAHTRWGPLPKAFPKHRAN